MSQPECGGEASFLGFQDHNGHGLDCRVRKRQRDIPDSQAVRELGRNAVKLQCGAPGGQVLHFKVLPTDAAFPPRANRLHPRFLGGESCGVAFKAVGLALYVGYFGGRVNALDETLSVPLDGPANAVYLGQIDARSNDHSSAPVEVMVRRPCLTPLVLIKASAIFFTAAAFPFTTRTSRQLS